MQAQAQRLHELTEAHLTLLKAGTSWCHSAEAFIQSAPEDMKHVVATATVHLTAALILVGEAVHVARES